MTDEDPTQQHVRMFNYRAIHLPNWIACNGGHITTITVEYDGGDDHWPMVMIHQKEVGDDSHSDSIILDEHSFPCVQSAITYTSRLLRMVRQEQLP